MAETLLIRQSADGPFTQMARQPFDRLEHRLSSKRQASEQSGFGVPDPGWDAGSQREIEIKETT